jgi:thymidylate synthase
MKNMDNKSLLLNGIVFDNANEAFEFFYDSINKYPLGKLGNTKTLYNQGFYIENPLDNHIDCSFRKWNPKYAEREWEWYLSGDPSGEEISKYAPIWKNHMDKCGNVRSNYGWQWNRNSQLDKIVEKLRVNKNTRQALLSIYDGKEIDTYDYDTPCTSSIHFQVVNGRLCMSVNMRSNDLWFGFCNDQYCFSKLQEIVAKRLNLEIGWYYHFASNLHLYEDKLGKS